MSSHHNDREVKKPIPRRLFSRTDDTTPTPWIYSPEGREQLTSSPVQDAPPTSQKDLRKALPFLTSNRSASPDSIAGAAQARWESIRQHVLMAAGQSRPGTPSSSTTPLPPLAPTTSYQHYQQPSLASSSASFPWPPSRSQTPKPGSRFAARLGFKHIVDYAREAAVDENRKLAEDVFRACWAARSGDAFSSSGGGRTKHGDTSTLNPMLTGTSSKHLPFVKGAASSIGAVAGSSSSLPAAAVMSSKRSEQQHSDGPASPYGSNQPSTSTFNISAGLASASLSTYNLINSTSHLPSNTAIQNAPSVKYLHQVLWQASGSSSSSLRSVYLPHEALVLSALLVPFTSMSSAGANDAAVAGRLEEERWLAIDAFDLVVKTWPPVNELASAERCLWCTKASTSLPASPLRSRILSAFWGLTNPNENTHVFLSPDTIHSISCGVFSLLPLISLPTPLSPSSPTQYRNPTRSFSQSSSGEGGSPEEKIAKEVLSHLSTGVLDEEACEDEYGGAKWNTKDDDADVIRQMMISEALAKCITCVEGQVASWLIRQYFEEYWVKLGDRPTALQTAISVRRLVHICNGILSLLSIPSTTSPDTEFSPTMAVQHIISHIDNIILPEIHVISSTVGFDSGEWIESKAKETRKSVTRIVLDLLCRSPPNGTTMRVGNVDPSRWAAGVITRWYSEPDGGRRWKESFEEMFKNLVTNAEWQIVVDRLIGFVSCMVLPGETAAVRKTVIAVVFPSLTDRLIQDPPVAHILSTTSTGSAYHNRPGSSYSESEPYSPSHSPSHSRSSSYADPSTSSQTTNTLPALLRLLSDTFPQIFFKPIFSLATSGPSTSSRNSSSGSSIIALANTLCVVHVLSAIMKDWWVRDAEMICVALMSDVVADPKGKGKARDDGVGGARLGQMVVLLELVGKLRELRRLRSSASGGGSASGSAGVFAAALGSDAAKLSRFVVGLEVKLSVLIEVKEKTQPLSPIQRLLFLTLFREIRLLTRSLKPAPWAATAIRWVEEYFQDEDAQSEEVRETFGEMKEVYEFAKGAVGNSSKRRTVFVMPNTTTNDKGSKTGSEESLNVPEMLDSTIKILSSLAKGFIPRAVKLLVTISALLTHSDWSRIAPLVWYHGLMYDSIHDIDAGGGKKTKAVMPLVCFLVMQCAEKNPLDFRAMVEVDIRSSDDLTRLESVHKLSLLVNWRFQLMSESHNILADRTHRLFKLARAPLPFVPTDIGSPNYVHTEDDTLSGFVSVQHYETNTNIKSRKANMKKDVIPAELRRRLVEIGWVDDDVQGDEKEMWIRTPVSLLPVSQVERLDMQRSENQQQSNRQSQDFGGSAPVSPGSSSPTASTGQLTPLGASTSRRSDGGGGGEGELLRRNSSSGGPTYAKRRAVFVPPLSLVFRVLALTVFDPNFAVASAARDTLLDLMRNDPGLLLRPILDLFCEEQGQGHEDNTVRDVPQAVNILTALIQTRHMIPPPMAHAMFNNLAGYLKYAFRLADPTLPLVPKRGDHLESSAAETLTSFALTVPIMAKLAMCVGELTIREIRKSKMEHFLVPYGTLWFNHVGVPGGSMFPRGLDLGVDDDGAGKRQPRPVNPFEQDYMSRGPTTVIVGLDSRLVSVMMIRIAQNMMFVDMLRKSPQDVVLVRKTMPKFVVPRLDGSEREEDGRMLSLSDFVPFTGGGPMAKGEDSLDVYAKKTLQVLSLALARSYVTLVAQVFRSMSRNSNDREEMANFVDGLNRILLVHGDDIGIVGHVLIAFMVASARFRRLFTSNGGYALFMPALAKTYAELHQRTDIRLAIEYAVYRFYALHREAFLFQSLDAIAHVTALPEIDAPRYVARVYDLFYSLRSGVVPTNVDPAGIHDINRSQEKEALLFRAAEDKPQTFLTAIRRGEAQTNGQIFFEVPDSYESSRLRMEDFVKLFLTIIAHDPSILRAQCFMRMFRFITPHLYHASTQARDILLDGLAALGDILPKAFAKSKAADSGNAVRVGEADVTVLNAMSGLEGQEKPKNTSNPSVMRLDFLFAILGAGQAGHHISSRIAQQGIQIAKLILKDGNVETSEPLSTFFAEVAKLVLLQGEPRPKIVIPFLQEIPPLIRSYITILNFTSTLESITQFSSSPTYPHDPVFAKLIVHELCPACLDACESISSETSPTRMHFRAAFIHMLAEAVFLRGSDVIAELEKRQPSFHLLSKVILPLTLTLKTSGQLALVRGRLEPWHDSTLKSAWLRLLFYAMTACQRSFRATENLPLSRPKSGEKSGEGKQLKVHLPTFTTALQIIKVIVVRAEDEISSTLPDLWNRLAVFLKSALMDGNANFALRKPGAREVSPLPSPTPSPRGSAYLDRSGQFSSPFFNSPEKSTIETSSITPSFRPRVIDYALWSILEFLCAYRSPLRLQLRLFTVEKVVALDQDLKQQRRPSPLASPNFTPTSRRISTSVFAKPRRSGMSPSPDSSPRASRSPSMIHDLSIPSIHLEPGMGHVASLEIPSSTSGGELRIPGYQYNSPTMSPSTPRQGAAPYRVDYQGPRIVHLGPTSPSALLPPTPISPSGGGSMGTSNIRLMAQSTKIKSMALIKATYRRIRAVQTFMGYDTLLPMPGASVGLGIAGLGAESDEVSFATWTKRSALEAILNEMKLLEQEFEEMLDNEGGFAESAQGENTHTEPISIFIDDSDAVAV